MPKSEPPEGATGHAEKRVEQADLASELASAPGEAYLPVLSTATLIALLELAAARVLLPHLAPGETSVGAGLEVRHTAPSLPGAHVAATARFTGREGRLYVFEVRASDEAGEIGRGVHRRAIVDAERMLASARRRRGEPA